MKYVELIYEELQSTSKNNPAKCRDIADKLNIREYDVRCAISHLRRNGVHIVGSKNGYYLPIHNGETTAIARQKQKGPYRVVITNGDGVIIRDVEFDDHIDEVERIHIRAKLINGRNIKL